MYVRGERYFHFDCGQRVDVEKVIGRQCEKLGYWRKHPDLHGFIVREFRDGRDESDFRVNLTIDRLQQIIEAVKANALPKTTGLHFGESKTANDQDTVEKPECAIAWLAVKEEGVSRYVIYESSW